MFLFESLDKNDIETSNFESRIYDLIKSFGINEDFTVKYGSANRFKIIHINEFDQLISWTNDQVDEIKNVVKSTPYFYNLHQILDKDDNYRFGVASILVIDYHPELDVELKRIDRDIKQYIPTYSEYIKIFDAAFSKNRKNEIRKICNNLKMTLKTYFAFIHRYIHSAEDISIVEMKLQKFGCSDSLKADLQKLAREYVMPDEIAEIREDYLLRTPTYPYNKRDLKQKINKRYWPLINLISTDNYVYDYNINQRNDEENTAEIKITTNNLNVGIFNICTFNSGYKTYLSIEAVSKNGKIIAPRRSFVGLTIYDCYESFLKSEINFIETGIEKTFKNY